MSFKKSNDGITSLSIDNATAVNLTASNINATSTNSTNVTADISVFKSNVLIEDKNVTIGKNNNANICHLGFEFEKTKGSINRSAFLQDYNDGKFKLIGDTVTQINDSTDLNSLTKGDLVIKNLETTDNINVGKNIIFGTTNSTLSNANYTWSMPTSSGALALQSAIPIDVCSLTTAQTVSGQKTFSAITTFSNTTDSTTTTTGGCTISGGLGVAKSVFATAVNVPTLPASLTGASMITTFSQNGNAEYGSPSQCSFYNGASVTDGSLSLPATGYVSFPNPNVIQQIGTIRFLYTPLYTQRPTSADVIILSYYGANGTFFQLEHNISSSFNFRIRAANGDIVNGSFGVWNATNGTEYEFELNINFIAKQTRLFINGTQQGSTAGFESFIQVPTESYLKLGPMTTNAPCKIRNLALFSTVQHTANYTSVIETYITDSFKNKITSDSCRLNNLTASSNFNVTSGKIYSGTTALTLPASSGTLALTSNIPSNYLTTDTIQSIAGRKHFQQALLTNIPTSDNDHFILASEGNKKRFSCKLNGAETGSNAGGNLNIQTYDDSGTFLNNSLYIQRNDGTVGTANKLKIDGGLISSLQSTLGTNEKNNIKIGKADSTYNHGLITFTQLGDNSTANNFSFGIAGTTSKIEFEGDGSCYFRSDLEGSSYNASSVNLSGSLGVAKKAYFNSDVNVGSIKFPANTNNGSFNYYYRTTFSLTFTDGSKTFSIPYILVRCGDVVTLTSNIATNNYVTFTASELSTNGFISSTGLDTDFRPNQSIISAVMIWDGNTNSYKSGWMMIQLDGKIEFKNEGNTGFVDTKIYSIYSHSVSWCV